MNYLHTIKWPILLIALLSLVPSYSESPSAREIEDVLVTAVRLVLCGWAGWLVASSQKRKSLWPSAWAGAVLFLVSHVVMKGGYFLVLEEFTAVGGVLLSYVMFLWVPMAAAAAGGASARSKARETLNK